MYLYMFAELESNEEMKEEGRYEVVQKIDKVGNIYYR